MATVIIQAKVTSQGVIIPRSLLAAWGEVEEVAIEWHGDAIVIKPKPVRVRDLHAEIVREMKAVGLIEELSWTRPPAVSAEERARLAKKLSHGKPLSEMIIEDRADRV